MTYSTAGHIGNFTFRAVVYFEVSCLCIGYRAIISFFVQACYSQECISVDSLPTVANLPPCPVGNGQQCYGNGVCTMYTAYGIYLNTLSDCTGM